MKKKKDFKKNKWLQPRSIRFDRDKLNKAKKLGVVGELNQACRDALDKLIGAQDV